MERAAWAAHTRMWVCACAACGCVGGFGARRARGGGVALMRGIAAFRLIVPFFFSLFRWEAVDGGRWVPAR